MHRIRAALLLLAILGLGAGVALQAQRPRRGNRGAAANAWIHGNLNAGLARARQTGKPLMVVIRCPP